MIAERYDAFLFDLDGVLYRGDEPIDGAADAVRRLRELDKGVAFVTNNSSRTPEDVVSHLRLVGIEAASGEVETSAIATARVLAEREVASAFVVGEDGLRSALTDAGLTILDGEPDAVDVVVVGWDRTATYDSLRIASVLVQRGATLVASNPDASYPAPDGSAWPGAGALLAAIETASGAQGEVIGKPHAPIFEDALRRAGGGTPLVVGDRMDTDIAGARRLRWDSMLVLTGISTRDDLRGAGFSPTYVADDLSLLVKE
jgi:glycerol-1-phosphatase